MHERLSQRETKIRTERLRVWFGENEVLKGIDFPVYTNQVTSIIGPSGCGKSTLLRMFNGMDRADPTHYFEGRVFLDGEDIYSRHADMLTVRTQIGMVFQRSNPFPKTIYDNVAYGPRLHQRLPRSELDARVEDTLRHAGLWDEVKDRLHKSALDLSGGQQQRLCIARALAVNPPTLLLDEPCSALDPIATTKIEDLIESLKEKHTIVIVTHNLGQAKRISDYVAFMYLGELVEFDTDDEVFNHPKNQLTLDYVSGNFG